MRTMKVYIKPWAEALKCAKESGVEHLVDTFDGIDLILGVPHRQGDWGRILETKKGSNEEFDYYTTYYRGEESFVYPACCVEEITPEWLEEHGEVFSEKEIIIPFDTWCFDTWCKDKYRIVVYKFHDHLKDYFFYVEWFYLDSVNKELAGWKAEKFLEIK